jgi:hypothetical protein
MSYQNVQHALADWGRWRAKAYRLPEQPITKGFTPPEYEKRKKECPTCGGRGEVSVLGPEGRERTKCPECKGKGHYVERVPLIDPATIPGPSVMRVAKEAPEIFENIDSAVNSFDIVPRVVVLTRYVYAPKAKELTRVNCANRILQANDHKSISGITFGSTLRDCQRRLSAITGLLF